MTQTPTPRKPLTPEQREARKQYHQALRDNATPEQKQREAEARRAKRAARSPETAEANAAYMRVWRQEAKECPEQREKSRVSNKKAKAGRTLEQLAAHNEDSRLRMNRKYREDPLFREAAITASVARRRRRLASDPKHRVVASIRSRIQQLIRGRYIKAAGTEKLLGCTWQQAREHLEAQFRPGMSWETYGQKGWHIDHIRPCASFDLSDPEQQRQCFHYSNLQPLWAAENLSKSDKWEADLPSLQTPC
jgi:hypothetical protein